MTPNLEARESRGNVQMPSFQPSMINTCTETGKDSLFRGETDWQKCPQGSPELGLTMQRTQGNAMGKISKGETTRMMDEETKKNKTLNKGSK